ncbi:MAG: hypothetical protein ACOCYE_09940 [Pseudomonadota bacterium]
MIVPRHSLFLVMALLLGACALGTVRDVDRMKQLTDAGDLEALAAFEVDCAPATEGCAQAHMIRADACLRRAQETPVAGRAPYAACAVEDYEAALVAAAARPDPLVDPLRLTRWELESLRLWRDAVARDQAAELNAELAEAAEQVAREQDTRPEGFYYLADARVWPVNAGLERPACPAILQASRLVERAAALADAGTVDVDQLRRDIDNAARVHGCTIAS